MKVTVSLYHPDYALYITVTVQPNVFSTVDKILKYFKATRWVLAGTDLTEKEFGRELCGPPEDCVGCGWCLQAAEEDGR